MENVSTITKTLSFPSLPGSTFVTSIDIIDAWDCWLQLTPVMDLNQYKGPEQFDTTYTFTQFVRSWTEYSNKICLVPNVAYPLLPGDPVHHEALPLPRPQTQL